MVLCNFSARSISIFSSLESLVSRELTLEKKKLTIEVEDISEELRVEQREKTEHMEQRRHLEVELTTARDTLDEKKEQGEEWVQGVIGLCEWETF